MKQPKPKSSRTKLTRSDTFRSPNCRRLLDYWLRLRGERARPAWADIDLMELRDITPYVLVRDAIDGGRDFGVRFFGTELVNHFQHDLSGKLLSERSDPESFEILRQRFAAGLHADGPVRVVGYVDLVETQSQKTFEQAILPLDGSDGPPNHIISVYDFDFELEGNDLGVAVSPDSWPRIEFPGANA